MRPTRNFTRSRTTASYERSRVDASARTSSIVTPNSCSLLSSPMREFFPESSKSASDVRRCDESHPNRGHSERTSTMPRYAALIYGAEPTSESQADTAMWDKIMQEYFNFGEAAAGVIAGGEALQPTSTATTIQVQGGAKGGDVVTTDGPFAETKETLGG